MKEKYLLFPLIALLIVAVKPAYAQIGGESTYEFLNLPNSARIAALGGEYLTAYDGDITLSLANPSLINADMHNNLGFSFVDYYSDIKYGYAQYGRNFEKLGAFVATMQFINYGIFDRADATGQRNGTFTAGEYALNIGWGRRLHPHWSIGANIKGIYSSFESYNSFGIAVDVAGSYIHEEGNFSMSLIARNIGLMLKGYYSGENHPLPMELQFGMSKGLEHIPLRFSFLYHNLETWDLTYDDPLVVAENTDPITGEVKDQSGVGDFADKFMTHIVLGAELNITNFLSLRGGYNYGRRQDNGVRTKMSTVGFSWGVGIRISKFHFSYARSRYHLAGSPNYITLTFNLQEFTKKRTAE
ncbi:MAG TPA: type IX secretion system protein PorQ [Bacteroidales bacterium]|nr:type IX secretion system protein PorQ [Bacteroidales bacterium]